MQEIERKMLSATPQITRGAMHLRVDQSKLVVIAGLENRPQGMLARQG